MLISFEQVKNYHDYCVISSDRSMLYLSLLGNEYLNNRSIDTLEEALEFAQDIASGVHHKDSIEDNSVTFKLHIAYVTQKLLQDNHNFHLLDGVDGLYRLVTIIEKERNKS